MIIKADKHTCFVFDLDDTLYLEMDYLKSAYKAISYLIEPEHSDELYTEMLEIYFSGNNSFGFLLEKYPKMNLSVEKLLNLYRNHQPKIILREGVFDLLFEIKNRGSKIGIITDGRGNTQRNKIKALGIESMIDKLVISEEFGNEKPAPVLFESIMKNEAFKQFYFFGDNPNKDFIAPKRLGWCCIGILDNKNIHYKDPSELSFEYLPHMFINRFTDIEII